MSAGTLLTGNFSLMDVSNLYGVNTYLDTFLGDFSLADVIDDVYGSVLTGDSLRDHFTDQGRPIIPESGVNVSSTFNSITVSFNLTVNSYNSNGVLSTTIRLERYSGSTVNQVVSRVESSDGNYSLTLSNLDPDTTYNIRLRYYNNFNRLTQDWDISGDGTRTTLLPPVQLDDYTYLSSVFNEFKFIWSYTSSNNDFLVQWHDEDDLSDPNSSPSDWDDAIVRNPYGGFDPEYEGFNLYGESKHWFSAIFERSQIDPSDNPVVFAIKKNGTAEPWTKSDFFLGDGQDDPNTSELSTFNATTNAASNIGETSATLSLSVSNFDNIANQQYTWRFQYRPVGGSWQTSSGGVSGVNTTHTESISGLNDDTTYEFRAEVLHSADNSIVDYGSILTFTTDAAPAVPTEPTNVQANSFQISWTHATVRDVYDVQARDTNDFSGTWYTVGSTSNNSISWNPCDYSVMGGFTDFDVRVRSRMFSGATSDWVTNFNAHLESCPF